MLKLLLMFNNTLFYTHTQRKREKDLLLGKERKRGRKSWERKNRKGKKSYITWTKIERHSTTTSQAILYSQRLFKRVHRSTSFELIVSTSFRSMRAAKGNRSLRRQFHKVVLQRRVTTLRPVRIRWLQS